MSEAKRYEGEFVLGMKLVRQRWALGGRAGHVYEVDGNEDSGRKEFLRANYLPAESPAAPVDRALAPGWSDDGPPGWCHSCPVGRITAPLLLRYSRLSGKGGHDLLCDEHAEKAGAFATRERVVPVLLIRPGAGETWPPAPAPVPTEPAPKPVPRCEYRTAAHDGAPVERVMQSGGAPKRMYVCDACYLVSEVKLNLVNGSWTTAPDNRPRATVGTSPVVFGLSVGILSRGMAR